MNGQLGTVQCTESSSIVVCVVAHLQMDAKRVAVLHIHAAGRERVSLVWGRLECARLGRLRVSLASCTHHVERVRERTRLLSAVGVHARDLHQRAVASKQNLGITRWIRGHACKSQ